MTVWLNWLILPQSLWENWLCGSSMLGLSLFSFALWRVMRELRMRVSFEQSASTLAIENEKLLARSMQLASDLDMLQETISGIGNKGDDWLGQLRFLHGAQKRENDRHSALLRCARSCVNTLRPLAGLTQHTRGSVLVTSLFGRRPQWPCAHRAAATHTALRLRPLDAPKHP